MNITIDIENSKTKEVITKKLPLIHFDKDLIKVDISLLSHEDKSVLLDAINEYKRHTDIELFYIDNDNVPYFGTDYEYKIINNTLIMEYNKKITKVKSETINDDWTTLYNNEFENIVIDFLKTEYKYLIIYYRNNKLNSTYLIDKPNDNIFMDMFFNKGYTGVALFKKKNTIKDGLTRENLEYINSYYEFDREIE